MVSVIGVYNSLREYVNQDQQGFVSPEAFNAFAELAQINIYNELLEDKFVEGMRLRRTGLDGAMERSAIKMNKEDLSPFITEQELEDIDDIRTFNDTTSDGVSLNVLHEGSSRVFRKPSDIGRIISARTTSCIDNNMEILYSVGKLNRILTNSLSKPTSEYPLMVIANRIQVFPENHTEQAYLTYYRVPRSVLTTDVQGVGRRGDVDYTSSPTLAVSNYDQGTGYFIPNPVNCRDFELPGHYKDEIVLEMAYLLGVSLRDTFLTSQSVLTDEETPR